MREAKRVEDVAEELRQWNLFHALNPVHTLYKAARKNGRTFYHPSMDAYLRNTQRIRAITKPPVFTPR